MLIHDSEIIKSIPSRNEPNDPSLEYCKGWHDHTGMGISVIGAYDTEDKRYHIFLEDNFDEFQRRLDATDIAVGFNNISFDDKLYRANGITLATEKSYDILVEIWRGLGLPLVFNFQSHGGLKASLNNVCKAQGLRVKTGSGAFAPVDWQRGNRGTVIDYCLNDVAMTLDLMKVIVTKGEILHPNGSGEVIPMRNPL